MVLVDTGIKKEGISKRRRQQRHCGCSPTIFAIAVDLFGKAWLLRPLLTHIDI
jgi:hypothetical protein